MLVRKSDEDAIREFLGKVKELQDTLPPHIQVVLHDYSQEFDVDKSSFHWNPMLRMLGDWARISIQVVVGK